MTPSKEYMSKGIIYNRRHFINNAFIAFGAAELSMIRLEGEQTTHQHSAYASMSESGINRSFEQIKQIDAGDLNVGYAEAGPADGPVVILLHGWPYDIHSFVEV